MDGFVTMKWFLGLLTTRLVELQPKSFQQGAQANWERSCLMGCVNVSISYEWF